MFDENKDDMEYVKNSLWDNWCNFNWFDEETEEYIAYTL